MKTRRGKKQKQQGVMHKHHCRPSSRGGKKEDITLWDAKFHINFHRLFGNMTTAEILRFIIVMNEPDGNWTSSDIKELICKIKGD